MKVTLYAALAALIVMGDVLTAQSAPGEVALDRRYRAAIAAVDSQWATDAREAVPGARSLLLGHGHRTPAVIVMLHGITNSPRQWAAMAARLHAAGSTVYVPRMPRHGAPGGGVHLLAQLTTDELIAAADRAVKVARGLGDTVVVVGLSAGGTMAAWVAQNQAVRRAVLLSPALQVTGVPSLLHPLVVAIAVNSPDVWHTGASDSTVSDRMEGWSSRGTAQVLRLGEMVTTAAESDPPRAAEIVLVVNPNDHTVRTGPARDLLALWARTGGTVRTVELPNMPVLPHDFIDPRERGGDTTVVYPLIERVLRGGRAP